MPLIEKIKSTDHYILFVYMYFFLMPWNLLKFQMGVLSIILFIWWIIKFKSKIFTKLKTILEFKPLVLLILFILFTYLATLWSVSISEGFEYVNKFHKYYFLIIPVLFTSLSMQEAKNSLKILIISFATYAIFSLLIYLGLFVIEDTHSNSSNPKGIMGYAIVTQYMAIGVLGSFFLAIFTEEKKHKYFYFLISCVCVLSLLINNSRTAQLALILAIITIIVLNFKYSYFTLKRVLIFSILAFVLFSSSLYFLETLGKLTRYKVAYNELKEVITKDKYQGSFGVRLYFNKVGIQVIKDNFFFGMGPEDNTRELNKIQKNDPNYKERYFTSYHSEHIDLLTRYGVIGYLLLISSIIVLLYNLRFNKKYYYIGLSFYTITFYISLANATFAKKPINYILISVFVLLSIIAFNNLKNKKYDRVK